MERRERLIRAMNPAGKRAHTADTQAMTLVLHDMAQSLPDGWSMGFAIADDGERADGQSNLDIFDSEIKPAMREQLRRRGGKDDDAKDDLSLVPVDAAVGGGHHILIQLTHESGAEVVRWIPRDELLNATSASGRVTMAARKGALATHIGAALTVGAERAKRRLSHG